MDEFRYDAGSGILDRFGNISWKVNGKYHRLDGPASEDSSGHQEWFLNGLLHRIGGPAVLYDDGDTSWYQNGKLHRTNGPACDFPFEGSERWYLNGKKHREDGPAVTYVDGGSSWWLNGHLAVRIQDQEIIIGKSVKIDHDVGIVLKKMTDIIYLVLLGNKKIFVKNTSTA